MWAFEVILPEKVSVWGSQMTSWQKLRLLCHGYRSWSMICLYILDLCLWKKKQTPDYFIVVLYPFFPRFCCSRFTSKTGPSVLGVHRGMVIGRAAAARRNCRSSSDVQIETSQREKFGDIDGAWLFFRFGGIWKFWSNQILQNLFGVWI